MRRFFSADPIHVINQFILLLSSKSLVMKTRPISGSYTIAQRAESYTKKDFESFTYALGIKFPHNARKASICRGYADYILTNLDSILSRISSWELSLLRDIVKEGRGKAVGVKYFMQSSLLLSVFMMKVEYDPTDGITWVEMPEDLFLALGDKPEKILSDPVYRKQDEYLRCFRGFLTLYGFYPLLNLMDDFQKLYPEILDDDGYEVFLCPEIQGAISSVDTYDDEVLHVAVSPFVWEVYGSVQSLAKDIRDGIEPRPFSKKEVLDAGSTPFPRFDTEASRRLRSFLRSKSTLSPEDTDEFLFELWLGHQDFRKSPLDFMDIVSEYLNLDSVHTFNEALQLIMEYVNTVPCWALGGNSSAGIQRRQGPWVRPPKMVVGPNMRKAGYTDADVQKMADAAFYGGVAESLQYKAGRNDPCPCGSGLKFKNCHGKGN